MSYPKTSQNTVQRKKDRANYDREVVHGIVKDNHGICHVAFVDDEGLPQCMPMLGCVHDDLDGETGEVWMYFHGYNSTRIMRVLSDIGTPITVTSTIVDGLVFALNISNHSMNYRSAILHGVSYPIDKDDRASKEMALTRVMESVMPGRWEDARPMTSREWSDVGVVRMKVESASAKIRKGPPGNDKNDVTNKALTDKTWSGVLPFRLVTEPPKPEEFCAEREVPKNIRSLARS